MVVESDPIWAAVIAAEDMHGEAAEDHARREAGKAAAAGDMVQAAIWQAAADTLHMLHSINRQWARPRGASFPGAEGRPDRTSA